MLGRSVEAVLPDLTWRDDLPIACAQAFLDLPTRAMPPLDAAERSLAEAASRLAELRASNSPWQVVRKAEVDWFGAAETVTLARAALDGRLEATAAACLPAEVQVVTAGPWAFAAWPGELFVEYGLAAKRRHPGLYMISLANGELQGYIATQEAVTEGGYESTNCLFAPAAGQLFVDETLRLLQRLNGGGSSSTSS
jgi:neutral ceramidase